VFQAGIVLGVILAAAYMGRKPSIMYIALPVVALGTVVLMRYPQAGLPAIVFGSVAVPFTIGTDSESPLHAGVLLLAAMLGLWLLQMLTNREIRFARSRTILPLIAFIVVAVISFVSGQLPWFPMAGAPFRAQIGGLLILVLSPAAFLLVGHQIRDLRWLERLTWLFLGLSSLYILARMVPRLWQLEAFFPSGVISGSMFWTWLVALTFSQVVFNRNLPLVGRLALVVLVLGTLYVSLFQARDWLSGWLPAIIAIIVALWVGSPRWGLVITLVAGAIVAVKFQGVYSGVMDQSNQYSLMTRTAAWQIMDEIIKVNPVLGLGPANYYWYTPLFRILGYNVSFNSHNNYVDIIAQTGILGLACLVWFAGELGRMAWKLRQRAPTGFARAYVCGALGGLAGTVAAGMLGDWILPFVYNVGLPGFRASALAWIFLGGLLAIEQMTARTSNESMA
jgi:hypothetical protein